MSSPAKPAAENSDAAPATAPSAATDSAPSAAPNRDASVDTQAGPSASADARRIRSFVRRAGRLTPAQGKALEELLPRYGVAAQATPISALGCFGDERPLVLEIGFGNGEALCWMAQVQSDHGFVGLEVHRPGVGHALRQIAELGLDNVRVLEADAVEVLRQRIAPASLAGVRIYFPDPWHKKRHNKRRLIQDPFLELLCQRLAPGGLLHLATDWRPYAEQMMEVCSRSAQLHNEAGPGQYIERPAWRPITRFERRGQRLGHGVWDLLFRRVDSTER